MQNRTVKIILSLLLLASLGLAGCRLIQAPVTAAPEQAVADEERKAENGATPVNAVLALPSEEVTFASDCLTLRGTLALPSAPGPHPALLTLTGSGAEDRDNGGSVLPGYRPFAQIAERLLPNGVAVLRFENRRMVNPEDLGADVTIAEIEVIPGVNHLFMAAESGDPQRWSSLPPEVPERVIDRIVSWVVAHVETE